MIEYIPLDQCVDRAVYRIRSNNLGVGVFSEKTKGFIGIRTKFGNKYLFTEYHYDTGAPFGTACPVEKIGVLPDNIENRELETNKNNQSLMDFLEPAGADEVRTCSDEWLRTQEHET